MIERVLIAALLSVAALFALGEVQAFHPLNMAESAISSASCTSQGWSVEACK